MSCEICCLSQRSHRVTTVIHTALLSFRHSEVDSMFISSMSESTPQAAPASVNSIQPSAAFCCAVIQKSIACALSSQRSWMSVIRSIYRQIVHGGCAIAQRPI